MQRTPTADAPPLTLASLEAAYNDDLRTLLDVALFQGGLASDEQWKQIGALNADAHSKPEETMESIVNDLERELPKVARRGGYWFYKQDKIASALGLLFVHAHFGRGGRGSFSARCRHFLEHMLPRRRSGLSPLQEGKVMRCALESKVRRLRHVLTKRNVKKIRLCSTICG